VKKIILLSLLSISGAVVAKTVVPVVTRTTTLQPPYYLSVKGWQNCTSTIQVSTWTSICLPAKKPSGCENTAWQNLTTNSSIPVCSKSSLAQRKSS
jgi:hypothetical protein